MQKFDYTIPMELQELYMQESILIEPLHFWSAIYANSRYRSTSQFVTASFHSFTSCSLVPP